MAAHQQPIIRTPNTSPEQQGQDLMQRAFAQGGRQRQGIQQFFQDPGRQQEINRTVGAGIDRAMFGLQEQVQERQRQDAFARARSGNIGGSVEAGQQADLLAQAQIGAANVNNSGELQRDRLQQALLSQQQQELLKSFGLNQFDQEAINQILGGLGTAEQGNRTAFTLDLQRREQERFANDELSRAFGNTINIGTTAFQAAQNRKELIAKDLQQKRLLEQG